MKKFLLTIAILTTSAFFLTSCGTTQEVGDSVPQEAARTQGTDETQKEGFAQNKEDEASNQEENSDSLDSVAFSESNDSNASKEAEASTENTNISDTTEENHTSEVNDSTTESENQTETSITEEPAVTAEPEEDTSEKVSEEDSNLNKGRDEAPTSDESDKVSEYLIFDEPEIIVLDLPEEETKAETKPAESKEEAKEPEQKNPVTEAGKTAVAVATPVAETKKDEKTQTKTEAEPKTEPSKTDEEKKDSDKTDGEKAEAEKEAEKAPIVPSRSVKVKINQYLDVTYPGTGWVYIGETEKNAIFNYFGRKLGTGNTTFALRAKKAGHTLLHFYKNDALTGEYIDDYLEVEVEGKKGSGRVKAPSYAEIVPAKPQRRIDRADSKATEVATSAEEQKTAQNTKTQASNSKDKKTTKQTSAKTNTKTPAKTNEKTTAKNTKKDEKTSPAPAVSQAPLSNAENDVKTVIQNTDSAPKSPAPEPQVAAIEKTEAKPVAVTPVSSESVRQEEKLPITKEVQQTAKPTADESLLEKAKKDFQDGQYELALNEATDYYNNASTRLDEALYLLGQIWESDSDQKNIRSSVDSYDALVKLYPASRLWKDAKNRSIYLKRFYIDIR